jgi:hypothetical protein
MPVDESSFNIQPGDTEKHCAIETNVVDAELATERLDGRFRQRFAVHKRPVHIEKRRRYVPDGVHARQSPSTID